MEEKDPDSAGQMAQVMIMRVLVCRLGAKIDWVQCDGCELWYHLKCVGLTPDQCNDNDEYHCPACSPRRSSPPASTPSPPTPPQHKTPSSSSSSPRASVAKRKTPKRPEGVDPSPGGKSKTSSSRTVAPSSMPAFGTLKPNAAVSSAVLSKDTVSQSVDSSPPMQTVSSGGSGFAAFARAGNVGGTKLFEFSTLAQNAVRRPSTSCSSSGSRDESLGKSVSDSAGSSFTFGQYLYTPWLAKSALAPR